MRLNNPIGLAIAAAQRSDLDVTFNDCDFPDQPVILKEKIALARTLEQFRHEYMGVPYTGDVDFLVIPAQDWSKP